MIAMFFVATSGKVEFTKLENDYNFGRLILIFMKGRYTNCLYKPGVLSINSNFALPFVMFEFSCFS